MYLPAPTLTLWYIASLVSEHRLILGLVTLFILALVGFSMRFGLEISSLLASLIALFSLLGISALEVQAQRTAKAEGVRLSFPAYAAGLTAPAPRPASTETYAVIGDEALQLDIWEPAQSSTTTRPAVVRIHGGFWTMGNRSEAAHWNDWLTEQGFVVFDIDYRLAPPARWQDAPGDVKCALGWVKQRANRFNINPEQIVLMGSSSGGHLALLAAYTSGNEQLPPSCPADNIEVAAVIALSAPTDLEWHYKLEFPAWYPDALTSTENLEAFTGGTPTSAAQAYQLGSPYNHVTEESPATLLVYGGRDKLVPGEDAKRLAGKLAKLGVAHRVLELPFASHLFDFIQGGWGTQITQAVIADFLAEYVPR